jgi:starvation-inducible DNA-binding protein
MAQQTTVPSIASIPGVDASLRDHLIESLNKNLATLTDLVVAYKQAHWNVVGRDFSQLHELFDEFANQTREYVDLVAERAVSLGGVADGTIQAAVEHTALSPFPREERDEVRLLEELARRVDRLVADLRDGIALATDEAVTEDLYIEITRGIEKQRWMLLAHLEGRGGNGRAR